MLFELLFSNLSKNSPLSEQDEETIKSVLTPKDVKKGEFLHRQGDIVRYGAFVTKGLLRSYVIDSKGKEHVVQFAPENWWISDKADVSHESKASYFIDAIEDSKVLVMDLAGHIKLMQQVPVYAASFQTGIQKRASAKDNRIVNSLTATAEERYNDFLESYPTIALRIPQHMLASYLGITPETLSRIRKLQSRKR